MRRIRIEFLVLDDVKKDVIISAMQTIRAEIESYDEKKIPKKGDVLTNYSFSMLKDAAFDFVNAIWVVITSFGKMLGWSAVMIVESAKYLWKNGLGSKDKKENDEEK